MQEEIDESKVVRLKVKWRKGGISEDLPEHSNFVSDLKAGVTQHLTHRIDALMQEDENTVRLSNFIFRGLHVRIC